MRFILCSTIIPPEIELILPGASPASGKYLRNLKNALEGKGYDVLIRSFLAIPGAIDAFKKSGISDKDQVYKDKTIIKSVKEYQKKVLDNLKKDDVLIFYNLDYYCFGLRKKAQKLGCKSIIILADHTASYKESGNIVRLILAKLREKEYHGFRKAIVLSEKAKSYFSKNADLIVMEGGLDISKFDSITAPTPKDTTCFMYAGTLSYVTGVDILLEAISKIKDDKVEFIISGKGELEEQVKAAAYADRRIKYLGFIPDEEYYDVLNSVDVFLNPRNMDLDQNRNNFPSKVLEYLATGRRVISTKFPGYERFTDYFEFYEGGADMLAKAMNETIDNTDSITGRFTKNRNAALEYDWNKQAEKLIGLIRD